MISFKPDGSAKLTVSLKNLDMFFNADDVEVDASDSNDDDDIGDEPQSVCATVPDDGKLDLIEVGSYVAIKAPSSSFEMFHVMKMMKKGIASENISDSSNEHFVTRGEPYLVGEWISISNESKKFVKYKESKSTEEALIHIGEVFATDLNFNDKLELSINDYRILCCKFWVQPLIDILVLLTFFLFFCDSGN